MRRHDAVPVAVPPGGLVLVRDGEPGEPEISPAPLTYHWQHRAEVEVVVAGTSAATRDAALDALLAAIAALAADRTLGGAVEWCGADVPRFDTVPVEGGAALKSPNCTRPKRNRRRPPMAETERGYRFRLSASGGRRYRPDHPDLDQPPPATCRT